MFKFKDIAMIGHKLLQMTTIASQASLISKEIDYGVFTELESISSKNQYLEIPSIALYYYYVYKMITEPAEISWFDQFVPVIRIARMLLRLKMLNHFIFCYQPLHQKIQ